MVDGPLKKVDLEAEALEFFFNSVDEHFVVLNGDGSVRRANGAFRRFVAPAAGADDVMLSTYLVEDCRERFLTALEKLKPRETIEKLTLTMRIGWDIRMVQASVSRSSSDCYYYSAVDITHEARLEQNRKETEEALAQLELLVGIGRWTTSKNKPSFWSPGMFRMLGMDENSKPLTQSELAKIMSAEDMKKMSNAFVEGEIGSSTQTVTCSVNCPDGQTRLIEFAGTPCFNADGSLDGVSGVALNKTNNVQELRSSIQTTTSVNAFLKHAPVGVAIVDLDGKVSLVNERLIDMLGRTDAHLLGSTVEQLWTKTPEQIRNSVSLALKGNTTDLKHQHISRSNSDQWIDWMCAPWEGEDDKICGAICIVKDVTQMVQEKQRTEASLARMEYGLSLSSMMVWEIDLLSKKVKIEGDWKPFFNQKPSLSELSNNLFQLIHPEDKPRVSKSWKNHICAGAPVHMSYRKNNAAGREIWVSVASRQEADENGKPVRMIGSMRDITVSQKTEYLTEALEQRVETKFQRKSSLIGDVGNSVSNQISSMLELSQALQKTGLEPEQNNILRLMDTSAEIARGALQDVDKYVGIHTSAFTNKTTSFNIKELVEQCIEEECSSAIQSRITPIWRDGADDIYQGNREKISESLALFASEVQKTLSEEDEIIIEVEVDNSGEGLCLLTFDVKFANPKLPYSDSILIELDNAEEEGLSLAIIHDFAKKLKGTVFYEKSGEGVSRILTEFPVMQKFEREASKETKGTVSSQNGLSVLVAEDNPLNRRVLELLAEQMQLNMSFVENGEEAVEAVKTQTYDAVIMDTQMPILSGLAAIRAIRGWEKTESVSPVPIIAAIPHMSFAKVREAMAVGANDCIAKPISQEDLQTHLSDLTIGGDWQLSAKQLAANE